VIGSAWLADLAHHLNQYSQTICWGDPMAHTITATIVAGLVSALSLPLSHKTSKQPHAHNEGTINQYRNRVFIHG
jgi:hypothetical protein